MFSEEGIAAITFTRGFRSAIVRIVASIAAAPAMSHFIVSMFLASLIERPPESNVMPLPLIAIGAAVPPPEYSSSIMRGSFTLPRPTPRIPPMPPRSRSAFFQILARRPVSLAIRCASFPR